MELRCDLDVIDCRGRFDSPRFWVGVFVDCICVFVFVAHGIRHYRMVGLLEDSLNDVDGLFVQEILHGLDVVRMELSLWIYR